MHYLRRNRSAAFETGANTNSRQVLYEQGNKTRGLNLYVDAGKVYVGAWNTKDDGGDTPWGPAFVSGSVAPNTAYVVTLTGEIWMIDGVSGPPYGVSR